MIPNTPYASEFTPDVEGSYLSSLMAPIDEEEQVDEGQARRAGMRSGGAGVQALVGADVGAARAAAADRRESVIGKSASGLAGMKREERLGDENRAMTAEKESFDNNQHSIDRSFRMGMAELGYQFESDMARKAQVAAQQGQVVGGLLMTGSILAGKGAQKGMSSYRDSQDNAAYDNQISDNPNYTGRAAGVPQASDYDW